MNKILLVNLGYSLKFIESSAQKLSHGDIKLDVIDFSDKNFNSEFLNISSARSLDYKNLIEKQSIRDFTYGIGKLSLKSFIYQKKDVRQLTINDLPLFWVTRIAEKHPFNNWIYNFFFFKNFIEQKKELFTQYLEIHVLFPYEYQLPIYSSIFFEGIDKEIKKKTHFRGENKPSFSKIKFIARLIKFFFKSLFKKLRASHYVKSTSFPPLNILLNVLGTKNSPIHDQILSVPSEPKVKSLILSSVFFSNDSISNYFRKNFPSFTEIIGLCSRIYTVYNYCYKGFYKEDSLELKAVIHEIIHALSDFNLLIIHKWMNKVFKNYHGKMQVFFEDEMYRSGRVVSHAALTSNNRNIVTFGYQHGNISESHTVYRFSSDEFKSLNKTDSVPMPDYFLVWGNYFKKQFLQTNNFPSEKIVVAGNLTYINIKDISKPDKEFKLKRILWCTTNIEFSLEELKVFSPWLNQASSDVELLIRMHPRLNIKDELLFELKKLSFKNIKWDTNKFLYDTLKQVDLVIGSAHSTIFIDGIVFRKPIIRLFNNAIFNDELNESELKIHNARNFEEFELCINEVMNFSESIDEDFLYMDNNVWVNILNYRFNSLGDVG